MVHGCQVGRPRNDIHPHKRWGMGELELALFQLPHLLFALSWEGDEMNKREINKVVMDWWLRHPCNVLIGDINEDENSLDDLTNRIFELQEAEDDSKSTGKVEK